MSQRQKYIDKANEVLRGLNALFPTDGVHQKFTWVWSETLWSMVPVLNDSGEQVNDYFCACGKNRRVHRASCKGLTTAKLRMRKEYLTSPNGPYASYPNMYLLCSWVEPPDIRDWHEMFGTEQDYPKNGRHVPVSRGPVCITIPPRAAPEEYPAISQVVVKMIRENEATWRTELEKKAAPKLEVPLYDNKGRMTAEPEQGAKFWEIRDRLKEKMPSFNPTGTVGYSSKVALP